MFLTVHATAGILIGKYTSNIWLAFLAGFFSHYLMDVVPHGDRDLDLGADKIKLKKVIKIALVDGLIMIAILSILFQRQLILLTWPILAAIAGQILPDVLTGFCLLIKSPWLKKYIIFHHLFHRPLKKFDVSFPVGLIIQWGLTMTFIALAVLL